MIDFSGEKSTLNDWLKVNLANAYLINSTCCRAINQYSNSLKNKVDDLSSPFSAEKAWDLSVDSLLFKFPKLADEILSVKEGCDVDFSVRNVEGNTPYTLDRGKGCYPFISVSYKGTAADIISIAHEFGHAVQLSITSHDFVPPILRELAAFIGELALLEHLSSIDPVMEKTLRAVWAQENQKYLLDDSEHLKKALEDEGAAYDYRWNYPVARYCAIELYKTLSNKQLEEVLKGHWSITECINASCNQEIMAIRNYLPEVPKVDKENPAINAYRSIGMMTLLDLDYWQGQSENCIGDYYEGLLSHLQKQSHMIAVGSDRKPIGYVTWEVNPEEVNEVRLTRQSAPFGDHLQVQQKLKSFFSEGVAVISNHERSARSEQVAW